MDSTDDNSKWWAFTIAGVLAVAFTIWEYVDLARLEVEGGEHLMSRKLAFIYDHLGKGGVLAFGLVLGILLIVYSLWERRNVLADRERERQKELERQATRP